MNKNREYPAVDQKIKDTYVKLGTATLKNQLYDSLVRFIRWSSERIHEKGVLAFVTNSSFLDSRTFDGFRNSIEQEFDYVYLVDLGGNVRKYLNDVHYTISGSNNNVFGIQTGVCISFLIKTGEKKPKAEIKYVHPFEIETLRTEKLEYLSKNSIADLGFEKVTPRKGYWLDTQETDFDELMPVASEDKKESAIFDFMSNGVKTNRDLWVYDLDERILREKITYFIDTYNELQKDFQGDEKAFENIDIKWSSTLKNLFLSKADCMWQKNKIINSMYRPFCKNLFYSDKILNDRLTQNHHTIFGQNLDKENVCISFNGRSTEELNPLASKILFDLEFTGACKGLSLYRYEGNERQDNITDGSLEKFRAHYKDDTITKLNIFHYVYAVFHNQDYVEKYRVDLQRGLPRVPFYKDFHELVGLGHELMRLHIDFEKAEKHKAVKLIESEGDIRPFLKAEKNKKREYTGTIFLDSITRFEGIPPRAFAYKLGHSSPMEWVLKQHAPKSPTAKDKQNYAKIFELFNTPENEFRRYKEVSRPYLIDLIPRLVTVSLRTMEMREKVRGRG